LLSKIRINTKISLYKVVVQTFIRGNCNFNNFIVVCLLSGWQKLRSYEALQLIAFGVGQIVIARVGQILPILLICQRPIVLNVWRGRFITLVLPTSNFRWKGGGQTSGRSFLFRGGF